MLFTMIPGSLRRRGNGSPPAPYNFTRRVLGYSGCYFYTEWFIRKPLGQEQQLLLCGASVHILEIQSPRNSYPPDAKSEANTLDRHAKTGNFTQAQCRHLDTLGYFDTGSSSPTNNLTRWNRKLSRICHLPTPSLRWHNPCRLQ